MLLYSVIYYLIIKNLKKTVFVNDSFLLYLIIAKIPNFYTNFAIKIANYLLFKFYSA